MPTIRELYGLNAPKQCVPKALLSGDRAIKIDQVVKSQELIGIEVEIENTNGNGGLNPVWQTHNDGSLRNNGMEFVTLPIAAEHAPVALYNLFHQYLDSSCCFSPRTSVHVHLNMQDSAPEKVIDLVLMYVVYEKLFYRFTGRGRQKNIYCVPLIDTNLLARFSNKRLERNDWSKYTGLNLLPVREYGTIEFRHMHGTNDVKKLTTWINLITSLKHYINNASTNEVRKTIATMGPEFDFRNHMAEIFGDFADDLKYQSLADVSYLQAKQALATDDTLLMMQKKASTNSLFYKFK